MVMFYLGVLVLSVGNIYLDAVTKLRFAVLLRQKRGMLRRFHTHATVSGTLVVSISGCVTWTCKVTK